MKRLVFLVLAFAVAAPAVLAQEVFEESKNLFSTRRQELSVPLLQGSALVIRSASGLMGEIEIVADSVEEARLRYYKKASTDSRSKAVDYIDLISVELEQTPSAVRLEMRAPNPPPWGDQESGRIEGYLMVPIDCAIKVDAAYFDVEATGPFLEFVNTSSFGRLTVSEVTERLEVGTKNRRVTIANVSGEVSASTSNSTLIARNVYCPESRASLVNDAGDILVDNIRGGLNIRTSFGRVDIEGLEPQGRGNYIRCNSGPIILELLSMIEGQLVVNNRYSDIELTVPPDLSAVMALAVDEEGRIEASNFVFKSELVGQNRLTLRSGEGNGLISGSVIGKGNIYVRGTDEED